MMPLAAFWASDGDRYELHARGPATGEPGLLVDPFDAARLLRWNLDLDDPFSGLRLPEDVLDELGRGDTSRFVLRRHPQERPDVSLEFPDPPVDLADLAGDPPPRAETTVSFEMIVVDEMGEPVPGLAIALRVDGAVESLTTDGDGRIRHDGARTSFASAEITSIDALRDELGPRWETIREGDWLDEELHHSYVDCSDPLPAISLQGNTPHTVVVQPRVVKARLAGMFFDTSKAFLLPSGLSEIKSVRALYEDRPDADVLIVGHTDTTGQPSYNDPLSLERADAMRAYLRDDVDAWLDFYGSDVSWEKRWGSREDNLMLTAVLAASAEPLTDTPMRHFQATRGLAVDGVAGPQTRRQLVTEYMAFDGTTLPQGIEPVAHGCGENFPLGEDGELDEDAPDNTEDVEDRRVELFFFDGTLGVLPRPPGDNSGPDSPEYPEWCRRARETHDFRAGEHRLAAVRVCDEEREPIANAPVRYPATGLTDVADDKGFIRIDEGIAGEWCDLEWTHPGQEAIEPWPFSRRVFVQFPAGEEGSRRKLHNVGYLISDELKANVLGYEIDFDFAPSGELRNIEPSLHAWHDGGEQPDPNAPPPPPPAGDPDKEKLGERGQATAAPLADTTKLLVGVTEDGVSDSKPLKKDEVSVEVVDGSGTSLSVKKVLRGKDGSLIFQFVGVTAGTYDVTARRDDPSGGVAAIKTKRGVVVKTGSDHTAVTLVLGEPATSAAFMDSGKKYGFDNFTDASEPVMTVETGKTDVVVLNIQPAKTFEQCTFSLSNSNCSVSPKPTADSTKLTITGKKKGITEINVMRAGESIGKLFVKVMDRQTKTVGVRLVHEKNYDATDIDTAELEKKLNEVYDQVAITFKVTRLPTMRVAFDLDKDGTLSTNGFMNVEQAKIRDGCKDDSFDFNLFIVAKPDDGKTGGHMGKKQRYGFIFSDTSKGPTRTAAHELGHALGLPHVEDNPGTVLATDTKNLMTREFHTATALRRDQWLLLG